MPVLTRENLAMRLRQNWLTKHPIDLCGSVTNLDDSLTSLSWLQNLNIMKITTATPPPSPQAGDVLTSLHFTGNMQVNPNAILNMTHLPCRIKQEPGLVPQSHVGCLEMAPSAINGTMDTLDYKSNAYVKPPYSYATLICMAMKESNLKKITLSGIYTWITENFMYYKVADPSWQNSIRHNLSLNKSFQKVARRKDEPGKGGFWRINPECEDMFHNGIFKKRRNCTLGHRDVIMPLAKRIKREGDEVSNGSTGSSFDEDSSGADNDITNGLHPSDAETKAATDGILHISDGMAQPMDFSLNAILHQDIEVGGVKVKTEDIIDERDAVSNSITSLSPPPSDTNSEVDLMDLLCRDLGVDLDTPLDLSSGDPLDLSVTGISLRAPGWWSETINASKELTEREEHDSGLHTPIAQSPVPDHNLSHPWDESHYDLGQSFDAGDIPSLFDLGTLSSNNAES